MSAAGVERVDVDAWRDTVAGALERGASFAAGWATHDAWNILLTGTHPLVLSCAPREGRVATIADLAEAAIWDEREAHDLYGVTFDGHEPLRPLVRRPADPAEWVTPVSGHGVNQIAVGPIHAGVIESGHFRFHAVGERILAMDLQLFHKHRGLERAAEGQATDDALAYAQRACAACAVTNTVAYAHAVEQLLGLWPDRELRVARTLALELERLYNHFHDIGAICAGVGFAPGAMAFAALKDRAQQLAAGICGHRFLFGAVLPGRGTFALDQAAADAARGAVRDMRVDAAGAWRALDFHSPLQARVDAVGLLDEHDALRLGATGPAARAAGIRRDLRTDSPRLWYPDFLAATIPDAIGDVSARLRIRAAELESTCDVLEELLGAAVPAGGTTPSREAAAIGAGLVESPRGATSCIVQLDATRSSVTRLHLRTGSYANWPGLVHATAGNMVPDFPLINKSFELCYACVDR